MCAIKKIFGKETRGKNENRLQDRNEVIKTNRDEKTKTKGKRHLETGK